MKLLFGIVLLSFALSAFAQDYPDSGFTNKAEAKNLMVNGLKEGKWVEYLDLNWNIQSDTSAPFYRLAKYTHDTISGMASIYMKNGKLRARIPYINGKKNGMGKSYDFYYSLIPYKNDKIDGLVKTYECDGGSLLIETPFVNGEINGVEKEYYHGGKRIKKETPYIDGKRNGIGKDYWQNGKLSTESPYKDGKLNGIKKIYYENGKIMAETPYINGKEIGVEKEYYRNGKIEQENIYSDSTNGESNWEQILYYKNGKMQSVCHYIDDNSDSADRREGVFLGYSKNPIAKYGIEKWWYLSGNLGAEIIYIKDSIVSEKYYDENGNLIVNGILKEYSPDKKIECENIIINGKLDTLLSFYSDGEINQKMPYSNGVENGIEVDYYESGKLESEITYKSNTIIATKNYDQNGNEIK